jgi:membrane protein implicated in regulation of membrane protease activity
VLLILAVVLLIVLPYPWNMVGFFLGLALFVGELLFWNRTVRGKRREVGVHTLVGRSATVISPCTPNGQVRVAGEIWAARCDGGASTGETVTIVAVDELTLVVEHPASFAS